MHVRWPHLERGTSIGERPSERALSAVRSLDSANGIRDSALVPITERPDDQLLADRTHRFPGCSRSWMFGVLIDPTWLQLEKGETRPVVLESEVDRCVVLSSFWPVSPDDTIRLDIEGVRDDCTVRMRWYSSNPPDDRGIGITRQRLNKKIGGDLRGMAAAS
jgi:hypothetical protein